tara:strand:+ start:245 stop:892 length:648 start_codon:yes stop_codon:yes gene_type:complete
MRVAGVSAIPTEAVPKQTTIGGQPHMLAYINPQEAQLLQDRGGIGSLFGIPTFFNPEDDMGLESSLSDQQSVSAGMGVTSTEGDQGTGPTDFGLSPFGGMGPNVSVDTKGNVTGIAGFDSNNSGSGGLSGSGTSGTGFSITPSQIGRGITSLLSLVPNPVQPIAQVISKGLTVKDIGEVIGGSREGPLGNIIGAIENFSLSDLTADLAAKARGEK